MSNIGPCEPSLIGIMESDINQYLFSFLPGKGEHKSKNVDSLHKLSQLCTTTRKYIVSENSGLFKNNRKPLEMWMKSQDFN